MANGQLTTGSAVIGGLIARLDQNDPRVRAELIERACERLRIMVRRQLRGFPAVRRWEETGDVLQSVLIELTRRLQSARPKDTREFYSLSGSIIRCKLIDLKRHYYGPLGMGKKHVTKISDKNGSDAPAEAEPPTPRDLDPGKALEWFDLHQAVEALPAELREVTNLLFYQGLSQVEVGELLERNVKWVSRRWREARIALGEKLGA